MFPLLLVAQRRYMIQERWEHKLEELAGFTKNDKDKQVDVIWGLHYSQYVGSHHLFGASFEGAWSAFTNNMPGVHITPGGGATGAHFVYEYQYSGILVQTGIGVNYQHVYNNLDTAEFYHYLMHDNWEQIKPADFTLRHQFYDRRDLSRNIYMQVPLYIGHYIIGPYGVGYYMGGLHANYVLWGSTEQKLKGTTEALYEPYLAVWHEMDNHGYRKDVPIERKGEGLKLKVDVMAHAEVGYEFVDFKGLRPYRRSSNGDNKDVRLRFAAFADFGIVNICPKTNNVLYGIPEATIYDFPTYRMDHVFSTTDAKAFWLRNLYVGMRITVLIGLPPGEQCILCDRGKH